MWCLLFSFGGERRGGCLILYFWCQNQLNFTKSNVPWCKLWLQPLSKWKYETFGPNSKKKCFMRKCLNTMLITWPCIISLHTWKCNHIWQVGYCWFQTLLLKYFNRHVERIHYQVSGWFICFNASHNVLYSHCNTIHVLTLEKCSILKFTCNNILFHCLDTLPYQRMGLV